MNPLRHTLPIAFSATLALITAPSWAQCPFDPTVTPSNLILCPNSQDQLSTQEYDGYQWYKAGVAIPGATDPTLTVDTYNDAAYYFKVEATLNGCTEMSPEVMVDGWAFLPPTAMTSDNYLFIDAGTAVFCEGDTARLVLMQPYDISIQWTDNGLDIPGATDDTLLVTSPGNFSVSGAPSLCPNFLQYLGVTVPVDFQPPVQPVIVPNGDQICATPTGFAYQWYLDEAPLAGGNSPCIEAVQPGTYTVYVSYENDCSLVSDGFLATGIGETLHPSNVRVSPMPARDQLTITSNDGTNIGSWRLLDATGRAVLQGDGQKRNVVTIDVTALKAGAYWLRTDDRAAVPVSVVQ